MPTSDDKDRANLEIARALRTLANGIVNSHAMNLSQAARVCWEAARRLEQMRPTDADQ